MEWDYLVPRDYLVPPVEENVFRPRLPSLTPTKTPVYANPYSSQKQSSISKLQYVLTKAPPTLMAPCGDCKLITVNGISKFVSAKDNHDCTIYCIRNPQLWLQRELREGVTRVRGEIFQTIPFVLVEAEGGISIENAAIQLGKYISEFFTEDIKNINEYLKRPEMINFINNLRSGKFSDLKNIPGVVTSSSALAFEPYQLTLSDSDERIVILNMRVPGILGERRYNFRRLPNNQIEVSGVFKIGGNAFKATVLEFIIPLFRI